MVLPYPSGSPGRSAYRKPFVTAAVAESNIFEYTWNPLVGLASAGGEELTLKSFAEHNGSLFTDALLEEEVRDVNADSLGSELDKLRPGKDNEETDDSLLLVVVSSFFGDNLSSLVVVLATIPFSTTSRLAMLHH